ncbi:HepT-like ribonuclease domain-containing protein [Rhodococcus sp. NPDC056743]|uniref:HepT-like ribonuclease domain-containing protein n=1 Tax=Rhodococcus sp. NPDC056743 TaxID=3345934 RepID=UPI00366AE9B6
MRRAVGQLVGVGSLDCERLEIDPATGLVLERILALLVDLAVTINNHVAESLLGEVPQKSADSFGAAEKAGMIDAELATALVPSEGPHNVLLQLYMDTEPEEVAAVVSAATSGYAEYVQQVTRWIEANASV